MAITSSWSTSSTSLVCFDIRATTVVADVYDLVRYNQMLFGVHGELYFVADDARFASQPSDFFLHPRRFEDDRPKTSVGRRY